VTASRRLHFATRFLERHWTLGARAILYVAARFHEAPRTCPLSPHLNPPGGSDKLGAGVGKVGGSGGHTFLLRTHPLTPTNRRANLPISSHGAGGSTGRRVRSAARQKKGLTPMSVRTTRPRTSSGRDHERSRGDVFGTSPAAAGANPRVGDLYPHRPGRERRGATSSSAGSTASHRA
jgi:hypothetical protein